MNTLNLPLGEPTEIVKVFDFAKKFHADQEYGKNRPYTYHLLKAFNLAKEYGFNNDILKSCLLHDVLEDTDCSFKLLESTFGKIVADIVFAVTDEELETRKIRKEKTYKKIKSNQYAIIVKIIDRVANIQACIEDRNIQKLEMYNKEHSQLFKAIYSTKHSEEVFRAWKIYAEYFNFKDSDLYKYNIKVKSYLISKNLKKQEISC